MPAYYDGNLEQPADLTKGTLYIYSLVPQKVDRVGVGVHYRSYNASKSFAFNFRWDQYPGDSLYRLQHCGINSFKISVLTLVPISVLWKLHIQDQTLQVLRNNEIANSFAAIICKLNQDNEITGRIEKMEITRFMSYGWSSSPLFYRYQPFPLALSGKIY